MGCQNVGMRDEIGRVERVDGTGRRAVPQRFGNPVVTEQPERQRLVDRWTSRVKPQSMTKMPFHEIDLVRFPGGACQLVMEFGLVGQDADGCGEVLDCREKFAATDRTAGRAQRVDERQRRNLNDRRQIQILFWTCAQSAHSLRPWQVQIAWCKILGA